MMNSPKSSQRMLTYEDLVNDMASGCKPKENWRIGIEHEQFVFRNDDHLPLPYDGKPGILQILEAFKKYGWQGAEKNGYLIELKREGAMVTLEPGGQIEIASAPHTDLKSMKAATDKFYAEFEEIARELDFGILACGFHPDWKPDNIHWMPKERYQIMGPYMSKKSRHGVDMMIRTCGAQINLDFDSEKDMIKKFRVALGLQPLVTALMANSAYVEGEGSGYQCYRSYIWTETDPERCGVPEFVFDETMSFSRYVDYALDVPMYFIIRNGHYIDVTGQSFRDFLKGNLKNAEGEYPTLSDWHDHLTTLFPEVRLKSYLEFRGPDSASRELVYAMSAFWTGIFYDEEALNQAYSLIESWSAADHVRLRNGVPKSGLETMTGSGDTLKSFARKAVSISQKGLENIDVSAIQDLEPFLEKLN